MEEAKRSGVLIMGTYECHWRSLTWEQGSYFVRVVDSEDPTSWEYGMRVFRDDGMTDDQFIAKCLRSVRYVARER
jgi:hypothetical protein